MEKEIYFLQNLADLAQLVIAGCALVALWQLLLTKKQLQRQKDEFELNSQRDSLKITIEQIRYYSTVVIPLYNSVDEKIKNASIAYFEKNTFFLKGKEVCSDTFIVDKLDADKIKKLLDDLGSIANRIEDFSIYLISGVANQEFAFKAMSDIFCSEVERLFPFYALAESKGISATLELYQIWKERMKRIDLENEKNKIEEQLKKYKGAAG